jgi:hypothetical protein
MKKLLIVVLCLIPVICFGQKTEFRDRYGNLVGTAQHNGSVIEVRDRYNNLVGSEHHRHGYTEYRDRYGNYLGSQERVDD